MKSKLRKNRTLALEIRLRRVGFAVFEGRKRSLEWGIRRWSADADPVLTIMRRIDPLLSLYSPSVVVMKDLGHGNEAKRRKVIMAVKRKLAKSLIDVHLVNKSNVKLAFRQSGNQNKYEIASTIAQMFPELKGKVSPKRKSYQPERYNAVIFDSLALALAHWAQCEICMEPADMEAS